MQLCKERMYSLIEELNFIRIGGTDEELKAAKIIMQAIDSTSTEVQLEAFPIDRYTINVAKLKITAPFEKEYTVTGYGLSGCTDKTGITAPLIYVEDSEDINFASAKGKIALLNGAISAKAFEKLHKYGVVGFVSISGEPYDNFSGIDLDERALRKTRHLKDGKLKPIPGVTIHATDAMEILRCEAETANILLLQEEYQSNSHNIIATIKGTDFPEEEIIFTAHYDSVPFSTGMYDNASGSVIIAELCHYFSCNKPKRTVKFIWCGSEEKGLLGSQEYVKKHSEELNNIKLVINVDLAGQIIGAEASKVTADESLCTYIKYLANECAFPINVKQDIYASDSSSFADKGVPAVSFMRFGRTGHNKLDTINLISPKSLLTTAEFVKIFSERMANSIVFPVPRDIPQNMKDKLDEYFGREKSK